MNFQLIKKEFNVALWRYFQHLFLQNVTDFLLGNGSMIITIAQKLIEQDNVACSKVDMFFITSTPQII